MRSVDTMVVIVVATIIIKANAILSVMLLMRIKVLKVRTNALRTVNARNSMMTQTTFWPIVTPIIMVMVIVMTISTLQNVFSMVEIVVLQFSIQ